MNRKIVALSVFVLLLFVSVFIHVTQDAQAVSLRPTVTPSRMPASPTLVGYLGVYTITGRVYDATSGLPLDGVEVRYDHFFLSEVAQPPDEVTQTLTDGEGRYTLGPVALRDTDTLSISAQAGGYAPQQIRLTGLDVYFGRRDDIDFELVILATLTPSPSQTVTPTQTPDLTRTTATPTVDLTRYTATPSFTPTRTPSRTSTPDLTRTTATPTANLTWTTATPSPTSTPT